VEDIQQLLAVTGVLIALVTSLYMLRSKGIVRFALQSKLTSGPRRLKSIERLPLTAQHSLHLVSISGRELLIGVSPGGCSVLDGTGLRVSSNEEGLVR